MASRRRALRVGPIRLRLTRAGWLFLLVSVLVGIASAQNQDSPLIFVLFGVMMGSLMVSITLAGRSLAGIRVVRSAAARAWQGQVVNLGYYVHNKRKYGSCLALSLKEAPPDGAEAVGGFCMHVGARGNFRAAGSLRPLRRGRIRLKRIDLRTTFPFGLVRADRRIRQSASIVVWPARGKLTRRLLRRGAVETSSAPPSQVSGGQDEFFGLREYRPGDNPRWIHWRRSATRKAPVVREMARPLPETLWVLVDTYRPDASQEGIALRERALRFTATLIDHAFVRGYQVAAAMARSDGPRAYPPATGRGQRNCLLDALSDVDANSSVTLDHVAASLQPKELRQSQVIVITLGADLPAGSLASLRRECKYCTVIGPDRMDGVFLDSPLERPEAEPCQ